MRKQFLTAPALSAAVLALLALGCGRTEIEQEPPMVMTLEPGHQLHVTPTETFSPENKEPGHEFAGTLAEPLEYEGEVLAPVGSPVFGQVVSVELPEKLERILGVKLNRLTLVTGDFVEISTAPVLQASRVERREEAPDIERSDVLTFTLDEPAEVTLVIEQPVSPSS